MRYTGGCFEICDALKLSKAGYEKLQRYLDRQQEVAKTNG